MTAQAYISALYRYPVKGFGAQRLHCVKLTERLCLPLDRAYAIENGTGRFDKNAPTFIPKINYVMLMRHEELAHFESHFDEQEHVLSLVKNGKTQISASLKSDEDCHRLTTYLEAILGDKARPPLKVVSSPGHSFSDDKEQLVHICNLNTVREFSDMAETSINPLRFRANIYVDGIDAWSETQWVDHIVKIGDVRLKVLRQTHRCAAINVDPDTGERSPTALETLRSHYKHENFGIFARVLTGGILEDGQELTLD